MSGFLFLVVYSSGTPLVGQLYWRHIERRPACLTVSQSKLHLLFKRLELRTLRLALLAFTLRHTTSKIKGPGSLH